MLAPEIQYWVQHHENRAASVQSCDIREVDVGRNWKDEPPYMALLEDETNQRLFQ